MHGALTLLSILSTHSLSLSPSLWLMHCARKEPRVGFSCCCTSQLMGGEGWGEGVKRKGDAQLYVSCPLQFPVCYIYTANCPGRVINFSTWQNIIPPNGVTELYFLFHLLSSLAELYYCCTAGLERFTLLFFFFFFFIYGVIWRSIAIYKTRANKVSTKAFAEFVELFTSLSLLHLSLGDVS